MSNPRSFLATVGDIRKGQLQIELAKQFQELVEAVKNTGRAGELTLTLKVAPLGKEGAMHSVVDDVKLKLPKVDKIATLFFVTPDNNHSLADPTQPQRNLKDAPEPPRTNLRGVPSESQPMREVN